MRDKVLIPFLLVILVSFYFFPISFTFFPEGLNTKMLMAIMGIIGFGYDKLQKGVFSISRTVLISALLAVVFSIWCLFSISENATSDTTYSRYWLSFATWLGGAYGVCFLIRELTGGLDLERLSFYLALVCLVQCVLAVWIDSSMALRAFVDRLVVQNQEFIHEVKRLYGIGASLDTAGVRFSVVLVLIAHQLSKNGLAMQSAAKAVFYFVSFAVITVIGSIIARTTWVGAGMGILYMIVSNLQTRRGVMEVRQVAFWLTLFAVVLVTVGISAYLYGHNEAFRANLRFGFEGFFNWAETGVFRTDSTDKLNRIMWIWPKDNRTWIMGTGLFADWAFGTDIGYCRFTLYCGLVGMVLFSIFFIYNGVAFGMRWENVTLLSISLIALTFIIWLKVSTDIFFIYALLFCLDAGKSPEEASPCTSSTT